ncbi:UNC-like C-terminal-domain-containing protein [Xylariaceae sp. FL0804]|nr:UNC-like C-terminal-domain-containing protein [Xylariaceae sp. FL0804]
MWPLLDTRLRAAASASLALLLLADASRPPGDPTSSAAQHVSRPSSSTISAEPTCESRTVNYITHMLPQQCLTSSPSNSPTESPSAAAAAVTSSSPESAAQTSAEASAEATTSLQADLDADGNDLSTGAFMSFEEWKAMMLAKSDPDTLEARPRKAKEAPPADDFDSLGDEGEINFDFDAYSDKISEIASSAKPSEQEPQSSKQVEEAQHDEGLVRYRNKDAGTTCKERFSYSSFDAGATMKKSSPGAKNPTAILIENKDSYMLLECGMENKFFIVELSDVVLVDTVVLANFEFFSSMMRQFRVSISDRYPVKPEKWKVLGTFEARNSRAIQPFLIENPQDWARYLRVEILSHYGNEYYCPVSLLRVHGLRMLDSWKAMDASDLDGDDEGLKSIPEGAVEEAVEAPGDPAEEIPAPEPTQLENLTVITEQSTWIPFWDQSYFKHTFLPHESCGLMDSLDPASEIHEDGPHPGPAKSQPVDTVEQTPLSVPSSVLVDGVTTALTVLSSDPRNASTSTIASAVSPTSIDRSDWTKPVETSSQARKPVDKASIIDTKNTTSGATRISGTDQTSTRKRTTAPTSMRPPSAKSSVKASPGSQTTSRNKTSTATSPGAATPTVQDSFFKALNKRLQHLESNTTLSLQYIESQSKFLQEALARLEKRQVAKVDLFLDSLNKTVLGELREVRTQYDQIWQSTVIALETQREQSEREIVALSSRLGVLADEVVFQKRMAIVQSVLLLGCFVLVIFSRGLFPGGGGIAGFDSSYYPSHFSRLASPVLPSTPRGLIRRGIGGGGGGGGTLANAADGSDSANDTPPRGGHGRDPNASPQPRVRLNGDSGQTSPEGPRKAGGQRRSSQQGQQSRHLRPPSPPSRASSDPSGIGFYQQQQQPPTPSSVGEMGYDSEPALTPTGDYFSAATSVNGDDPLAPASSASALSSAASYPELLARQAERQLTPASEHADPAAAGGPSDYDYLASRPGGKPALMRVGSSARKPLPALPEDPD